MGCLFSKPAGATGAAGYADYASSSSENPASTPRFQATHDSPALSGLTRRSRGASAAGPSAPQSPLAQRNLTSLSTLPPDMQEHFLNSYDPVRKLNLRNDSVFYRCTEKQWVKNGAMAGHPHSGTVIDNHHFIQPDPVYPVMISMGLSGRRCPYMPVRMQASELNIPSLNVMYGEDALRSARNYALRGKRVTVAMTLGDLRRAGGGEVYIDPCAAGAGTSSALIVTLPRGRTVPVRIVD